MLAWKIKYIPISSFQIKNSYFRKTSLKYSTLNHKCFVPKGNNPTHWPLVLSERGLTSVHFYSSYTGPAGLVSRLEFVRNTRKRNTPLKYDLKKVFLTTKLVFLKVLDIKIRIEVISGIAPERSKRRFNILLSNQIIKYRTKASSNIPFLKIISQV